ncbi:autotransporter domain-containing protein, partial [Parvibaculum sp.]|uniref:autotransporter family protein n=1 Tax=Parvibaculum sp. TaxID=2024848 RepID=UPI002C212ACA
AGDPTFTVGIGNTDTISGTISDGTTPGDVVKAGDGTLILSAINSYTGATTVDAGTLNVTGSIASSSLTTVNSGATLLGTGAVGNLEVASGGIFAPGAAGIAGGSTTVSGTLTLGIGSTYLVAVNPSTASYADVSGTASLHGTVLAAFDTGAYVGRQYTILQSAGLDHTTFDNLSVTDLPSGFAASLEYTDNDVLLDLTAVLGAGDTLDRNQRNVADGLNTYFNNGGTMPSNFLTIFGLSGGNLAGALSGLSGEVATGGSAGSFRLMSQFLGLLSGTPEMGAGGGTLSFAPEGGPALPAVASAYAPTAAAAAPSDGQWKLWGTGFGSANRVDGDPVAGSHRVTSNDYGFAAGADYGYSADTVLGFAVAGGGTSWDLARGLGGGDSDALQLGLHAATRFGPAYVSAALGFANHWMTTDRAAYGDRLSADFKAQLYAGRLEAGYRLAPTATLGLTPYAALQVQHFRSPGYSETDVGGGGYALAYEARSMTDTRSELGARLDQATMLGGDRLVLKVGAAWAHDHVTGNSATAGFRSLPGSSFTVSGADTPHDTALVSTGAELQLAANLTLSASFDGEFASGYRSLGGTGVLRYSW